MTIINISTEKTLSAAVIEVDVLKTVVTPKLFESRMLSPAEIVISALGLKQSLVIGINRFITEKFFISLLNNVEHSILLLSETMALIVLVPVCIENI